MKLNKQKIGLFFTGVLTGTIISGVFFIFKLDGYFKTLSIRESIAETNEINVIDRKPEVESITEQPKKIVSSLPTGLKSSENLSVYQPKLTVNKSKSDTLTQPSEVVYLKNDELVFSKSIKLISNNSITVVKDTMAASLAGVTEIKPIESIKVEFWLSPLNYKGYRMSRTKLLLYGISADENVKLYVFDGEYYLYSSKDLYRLTIANEFNPFDRVINSDLISKLKTDESSNTSISLQR